MVSLNRIWVRTMMQEENLDIKLSHTKALGLWHFRAEPLFRMQK